MNELDIRNWIKKYRDVNERAIPMAKPEELEFFKGYKQALDDLANDVDEAYGAEVVYGVHQVVHCATPTESELHKFACDVVDGLGSLYIGEDVHGGWKWEVVYLVDFTHVIYGVENCMKILNMIADQMKVKSGD